MSVVRKGVRRFKPGVVTVGQLLLFAGLSRFRGHYNLCAHLRPYPTAVYTMSVGVGLSTETIVEHDYVVERPSKPEPGRSAWPDNGLMRTLRGPILQPLLDVYTLPHCKVALPSPKVRECSMSQQKSLSRPPHCTSNPTCHISHFQLENVR